MNFFGFATVFRFFILLRENTIKALELY